MSASMGGTVLGLLHEFAVVAAALPAELALYCVPVAALLVLFLLFVRGGQFARAFWCVVLILVVDFLFSSGEDTSHHVYRIIALSAQLRHGGTDFLLTNPATEEVFPVFVYYSFVPYILPVLLHIAGCAPLLAFKVAMALQLVVLAAGLQALLTKIPLTEEHHASRAGYLLCILFVTATYVDGLWWTRAALGEIWVYSLAPWVVYAILSPCQPRLLFMLLFVQICAHPIVFIHGLVAELVAAFGVSSLSLVTVLRRTVAPLVIALAVGSPYWLPQFLWMHDVLGNSAIPLKFEDTFLYVADLINPLHPRNLGIWLPLALVTMIGASRERLPLRAWVLVVFFVALLALQHARLRDITTHVPVLDLSQYVWRLMFPTAFIAFAALVAGWRALSTPAARIVCTLTLLSPFSLLLSHAIALPHNLMLLAHVRYDNAGYAGYLRARNVWGVAPFAPNYVDLPQKCDAALGGETHSASFRQLRAGVRADSGFVSVKGAPIGFVDYKVNGVSIHPQACRDALLFGPLAPNSTVSVSESRLDHLLYLRVLTLILGLAGSLPLMQLARFLRRWVSSPG
jgi:hypothetical protein